MSAHERIGRAGGARVKRALGVQAILEWAFRVEKAQLELPQRRDIDKEGYGFGMDYVLIQRARLGCKVDGGVINRSPTLMRMPRLWPRPWQECPTVLVANAWRSMWPNWRALE